jgi:uncharacterized protein (DUF488 family)
MCYNPAPAPSPFVAGWEPDVAVIYSIGHSNHTVEQLIALLRAHQVRILADVRSSAWSARNPQFNGPSLREALENAGIAYVPLQNLGGKPRDPGLYQRNGLPDYDRIASSQAFRAGLEQLEKMAETDRTAMLCAEADPAECHRERLVAPELRKRGHEVRHILADGSLAPQSGQTALEL